jgi:two-component system KDP operon response regulator KdpE
MTVKYPELLEAVWGRPGASPDEEALRLQALRVHINSLRRKLELDPKTPQLILTEPGRGYRLWSES